MYWRLLPAPSCAWWAWKGANTFCYRSGGSSANKMSSLQHSLRWRQPTKGKKKWKVLVGTGTALIPSVTASEVHLCKDTPATHRTPGPDTRGGSKPNQTTLQRAGARVHTVPEEGWMSCSFGRQQLSCFWLFLVTVWALCPPTSRLTAQTEQKGAWTHAVLSSYLIAGNTGTEVSGMIIPPILWDWYKGSIHPDLCWPEKFASFFFLP